MSEKLYARLLRLYPSHFREEYGEEALRLFCDRARDERGFFPRLRLWMDLFFDLTISLPREYLHIPAPRVVPSAPQPLDGVPTFYVLQNESPRPGALLFGGVVSLVALTTCWVSLNQVHRATYPAASQFSGAQDGSQSSHDESRQSTARASIGTTGGATTQPGTLDPAERKRILKSAMANLKEHYVDRHAAQKMAEAVAAHENRGEYNDVADPVAFAALLTEQMREVTPDRHLTFDYFQEQLPPQPPAQTPPHVSAQYRETMKRQNCTFEKVELLPRNIGYLKLNSFPDPEVCRVAAMAAMTYVNRADAVIFDLRDNRGGSPEMVQLIGAYLFDHPEYWYNPREATSEQSWTQSPVPGSTLADKPVFVLTSARTFSGAEQFCYDLKMLKRATLVGEPPPAPPIPAYSIVSTIISAWGFPKSKRLIHTPRTIGRKSALSRI